MGWDRIGWDGMGLDGMGWDGMEWNGMEWNGMEWNRIEYLNNRVFLSRNYRLRGAPRKFADVLKTNICPRSEASTANMLVVRTSNFQGQLLDR